MPTPASSGTPAAVQSTGENGASKPPIAGHQEPKAQEEQSEGSEEEPQKKPEPKAPVAQQQSSSPLAMLLGTAPEAKAAKAAEEAEPEAEAEAKVAKAEEAEAEVAKAVSTVRQSENQELKASKMTNYNQLEGKKMDEQLINIGGELFSVKYDKAARKRRQAFFNNEPGALLTKEEERLLTYLSIVDDTRDAIRGSLYDFFEAMPDCQSSAAILSNRKCEVSYYVIWSVLLKARQDVQRKIDDASKTALDDEKLLQYQARLKSMSTRAIGPIDGKTPCDGNKEQHAEIIRMIKDLQKQITTKGGQQSGQSGGKRQLGQSGQSGGALSFLQRIYASITD